MSRRAVNARATRRLRRWAGRLAVAAVVVASAVSGARAQMVNGVGAREIETLRKAEAHERAGDFVAAERAYRSILNGRPTALSALLGLERVLRMQGEMDELLPFVERLLAEDPDSPIGHQLALRSFSSLNRIDDMADAADAWLRTTPEVETPYREIARAWRMRGDYDRAIDVLERGRERLGGGALALELGALYATEGSVEQAEREWESAIGREAEGLLRVRRRLRALPDGGAAILPGLIDELIREPTTLARRRAAAELAVDAGLTARAERIGRAVVSDLEGTELESFLIEMARRADAVRLQRVAYWAYGRLLAVGGSDERRLAIRNRVAELALMVGDTTSAREHYAVIERAYEAGSPARREAAAVRIALTVRDGDVDEALAAFRTFRRQYPDAPELDRLAGSIAGELFARAEDDRAREVLTGIRGPRSGLLRSRLALSRGDVQTARATLLTVAAGLGGAEATEAIELATLLGRVSADGGRLIGRATDLVTRGEPQDAVALLTQDSGGLEAEERAAVLDYAAGLADRAGLAVRAERIRRTIVADYSESAVAPAALLALARTIAGRAGGLEEARTLLTRLILEHPRSALVPQARRELDRIESRIPSS